MSFNGWELSVDFSCLLPLVPDDFGFVLAVIRCLAIFFFLVTTYIGIYYAYI